MNKYKLGIICAVAAAALVTDLMQFQAIKALRQENENLRQQTAQMTALQDELARMKEEATTAAAPAAPDAQVHELARLRSQVAMLRSQTNELAKARQEIASLKQRVVSESDARQTEDQARRSELAAFQAQAKQAKDTDTCLNYLRLIDAAKQQWALENKKQSTDTPSIEDLRPFLGKGPNAEVPTCPDGGTYTIGAVGEKPTCSNPAHVLP